MTLGTTDGESPRGIKEYARNRNIPGSERMMVLIERACREGENGIAAGMIDELLLLELDAENPDKIIPILSENFGSTRESEVLCDVRKKSRMASYRVVAIVRELAKIEGYVTALFKTHKSIEKNGVQGTISNMPDCGEHTEEVSRILQWFSKTKATDKSTYYTLCLRAGESMGRHTKLSEMLAYELKREDWDKKDELVITTARMRTRGIGRRAKEMIERVTYEARKETHYERIKFRPRIPAPTFAGDIAKRLDDACRRKFPTRVGQPTGRPAAPTTAKRLWRTTRDRV